MGLAITARDPGSKPGIVQLDDAGRLLRATHRDDVALQWPDAPLVATEGQWWFAHKKKGQQVDPNRLFVLARESGWGLRPYRSTSGRYLFLLPEVWRKVAGRVEKEQVQRQILRTLSTEERKLFADIPKSRHGDVLDAIGIGRGALHWAPLTKKYDWPK